MKIRSWFVHALAFTVAAALIELGAFAANEATFTDTETYSISGVTISVSDSYTLNVPGTNVNYVPFTVNSTDTTLTVNPLISNGWLRVKNTAPLTSTNYIALGNNGTDYPIRIMPGEVFKGRFVLDGSGALHAICSNGTATAAALWLPSN